MSLIKNIISNRNISLVLCILIPISFIVGNAAINILSLFIFLFFIINILKEKNLEFFKQRYIYLLFICYLFILISLIFSNYISTILFKSLILFKIVILPVCFQYFFLKNSQRIIFFYTCFLVVLFVCFDAWIQYFFNVNLFGANITGINDTSRRISGIFFDEKILGSFIKIFAIFGTCYLIILKKQKIINFIIPYSFFLICLFTILITQERSSFLIFFLIATFIFIYMIYKNKKNILFIILPIILISYLFISDSYIKNRYISTFSTGAGFGEVTYLKPTVTENKNTREPPQFNLTNVINNFTIKNSLWGAHFVTATEIFKHNLVIGSGPKTFRFECSKKKYDKLKIKYIDKRCSTHPHNFVFEILSELGILGFISFLVTFIYIIYSRIKIFFKINSLTFNLIFLTFFMNNWPIATTGSLFSSQNIFINSLLLGLLFSYSARNLFNRS